MSLISWKATDSYAREWRRTVKFYTASLSAFRGFSFPNKMVRKEDKQVCLSRHSKWIITFNVKYCSSKIS